MNQMLLKSTCLTFSLLFFCTNLNAQLENEKLYKSLEKAIENPNEVHRLDLSYKRLTEFPREIEGFKYLKELNLSGNPGLDFNKVFHSLQNHNKLLVKLDVSSNNLKMLPPELFFLVYLEDLRLNDNKLIKVSALIRKLSLLKYIDLSYNQLTKLPKQMKYLRKNIKLISIQNNKITPWEQGKIRRMLPDTKIYFK